METHSSILARKIPLMRSLVDYGQWGCKEVDMTERAAWPLRSSTSKLQIWGKAVCDTCEPTSPQVRSPIQPVECGAVGAGQGESLSLLPVPLGPFGSFLVCGDTGPLLSVRTSKCGAQSLLIRPRYLRKPCQKEISSRANSAHMYGENQALVKLLAEFCPVVL